MTCFCFSRMLYDFFSSLRNRQASRCCRLSSTFSAFITDLEAESRSLHWLIDRCVFSRELRMFYTSLFSRETSLDFSSSSEHSVARLFLVLLVLLVAGGSLFGWSSFLMVLPRRCLPFCLLTILPALPFCMVFSLPSESIFLRLKNSAVELWSNLLAYLMVCSLQVSSVIGMICVSSSDSFICSEESCFETLRPCSPASDCCERFFSESEKARESAPFVTLEEELPPEGSARGRGKRLKGLCIQRIQVLQTTLEPSAQKKAFFSQDATPLSKAIQKTQERIQRSLIKIFLNLNSTHYRQYSRFWLISAASSLLMPLNLPFNLQKCMQVFGEPREQQQYLQGEIENSNKSNSHHFMFPYNSLLYCLLPRLPRPPF